MPIEQLSAGIWSYQASCDNQKRTSQTWASKMFFSMDQFFPSRRDKNSLILGQSWGPRFKPSQLWKQVGLIYICCTIKADSKLGSVVLNMCIFDDFKVIM